MCKKFILLLVAAAVFVFPDAGLAQRNAGVLNWPKFRFEKTVHRLPEEIRSVAPFDTDAWFSISDDDNREQVYLQTLYFLASDYGISEWFEDESIGVRVKNDPFVRKRSKQTRSDLEKMSQLARDSDQWSPRRGQFEIEKKYSKRIQKVVKKFIWVFDELESAQQYRSKCHFHKEYVNSSFAGFNNSVQTFELLCQVLYAIEPPKEISHFRACKILLRFAHDLGPDHHDKSYTMERFALKRLLTLAASDCESEEEIDKAIAFLREHIARSESTDATLEKAKWQFITFAKSLVAVRDKDYANDPNYRNNSLVEAQLGTFQRAFSNAVVWPDRIADSIESRLKAKFESIVQYSDDEKEQFKEAVEKLRIAQKEKNFDVVDKAMASLLDGMTKADFAKELQYQANRFRAINSACGKNAVDRSSDMRKLQQLWSLDSAWTESPILNYIPCERFQDVELELRFLQRAALCLAVVTKWRLSHDGNPPTSLEEAFKDANAGSVPMDPYDESKRLVMKNSKVASYIDTVGLKGETPPLMKIEF